MFCHQLAPAMQPMASFYFGFSSHKTHFLRKIHCKLKPVRKLVWSSALFDPDETTVSIFLNWWFWWSMGSKIDIIASLNTVGSRVYASLREYNLISKDDNFQWSYSCTCTAHSYALYIYIRTVYVVLQSRIRIRRLPSPHLTANLLVGCHLGCHLAAGWPLWGATEEKNYENEPIVLQKNI